MDTPSRNVAAGPADNFSGLILAKDFQLVRRLGEGGMGQVYLAEQLSLRRKVAVKLLRAELAQDEVSRRRFETEAKAVAQLNHANIVQVYAVGDQDGLLFMALEFVDGWTLKDYLTRKGPPELPVALSIMRQVAAALARAAEVGIIHRDIKPENILLTRKVEVKVTDFGLSRIIGQGQGLNLTQTGTSMGTPLYMSPEQVMGVPLDPRTDLYSFGATCYHMLAGQPPFNGDSAMAVGIKHVQEEPEPLLKLRPDLPPELAALVQRLLAKKPEERPQTAREVLRDLKRIADQTFGAAGSNPNANINLGALSSTKLQAPGTRIAGPADVTEPYIVESGPHPVRKGWPAWMPWALGISLLLAVLAGALVGQLLKSRDEPAPAAASLPAPSPSPSDTKAAEPGESDKDGPLPRPPRPKDARPLLGLRPDAHERDLIRRVDETRNPQLGQKDRIREGARVRGELAWHYLILDPAPAKALVFFEEQTKSKVPDYQLIGEAGLAIIASRRDPARSVELFARLQERLGRNEFEKRIFDELIAMPDRNLAKLLMQALTAVKNSVPNANVPKSVQDLYLQVRGAAPGLDRKEERKASKPEK